MHYTHRFSCGLPPRTGFLLCTLAAAFALSMSDGHAQNNLDEDFDNQEKPWQEIEIQLPPAPKPENLAPFDVSGTVTQDFAIDLASVSLGADGVIRYSVVAVGEGGARNISYEGIRCATYERKLYAFGRPDGSWSRARRDQWERISSGVTNKYHAALVQSYFCENKTVSGDQSAIIDRLRSRRPLGGEKYR